MEERNITVDIKTAREWYNSSNSTLKTLALKAFTEKEIQTPFPKSWEEFVEYRTNTCSPTYYSSIHKVSKIPGDCLCSFYDVFGSEGEAKAYRALGKLINLRDAWWKADGDWKPDWNNEESKWCLEVIQGKIYKSKFSHVSRILVFRTLELQEEFLRNFKDLIEEAKMFL